MTKSPTRHVALLVHTANDWTRLILRGVVSYARDGRDWNMLLEPRGLHERLSLPPNWHGDGVILRLAHATLADDVLRRKVPAVNVSWLGCHSPEIPKVAADERASAQVGLGHLREKGFKSLAFVGPDPALGYSDTVDRECRRLCSDTTYSSLMPAGSRSERIATIKQWLQITPKPLGILAWNSIVSQDVLSACAALHCHVPDEVGIVCIEHDHLMASITNTPLTSIDQDPMRVGYEAAKLLDSLMDAASPPQEPILVKPQGIICRQSTDTSRTDDPIVSAAMAFIQTHYSRPIQVSDICKECDVSRRQLEHRFRFAIDSTPAKEIQKARLASVKRLLVETQFSMEKISKTSGYDYAEVMMRAFKREFGQTPGEFRRMR